jgi:ketosteroid isomerase-like protein
MIDKNHSFIFGCILFCSLYQPYTTMKKLVLISVLVLSSFVSFAQDLRQEINKQVWTPFIEGYNSFDAEKFMSVYSRNVVRVPVDEKKIFNFSEYKKAVNREYQFNKNYKVKATIELRFNQRIHTADKAYEKGIFKISMKDNNGKPETIYSSFQVVLQKENGFWKITFDSDSAEGSTLGEKDFQSATPL